MKICPQCLLEFVMEKETCAECDSKLIKQEHFSTEVNWPHCKKCQTTADEKDMKCSNCGQAFYLVPFAPKIAAFAGAVLVLLATGFVLDKAGISPNTIKIIAIAASVITWGVITRRVNTTTQPASIPWNSMSPKKRAELREEIRNSS